MALNCVILVFAELVFSARGMFFGQCVGDCVRRSSDEAVLLPFEYREKKTPLSRFSLVLMPELATNDRFLEEVNFKRRRANKSIELYTESRTCDSTDVSRKDSEIRNGSSPLNGEPVKPNEDTCCVCFLDESELVGDLGKDGPIWVRINCGESHRLCCACASKLLRCKPRSARRCPLCREPFTDFRPDMSEMEFSEWFLHSEEVFHCRAGDVPKDFICEALEKSAPYMRVLEEEHSREGYARNKMLQKAYFDATIQIMREDDFPNMRYPLYSRKRGISVLMEIELETVLKGFDAGSVPLHLRNNESIMRMIVMKSSLPLLVLCSSALRACKKFVSTLR